MLKALNIKCHIHFNSNSVILFMQNLEDYIIEFFLSEIKVFIYFYEET